MQRIALSSICLLFSVAIFTFADDAQKIETKRWEAQLEVLDKELEKDAKSVNLYSQRGDINFYLGRFKQAVSDYQKMTQIDPALEAGHWRNGIALFYAGRYKDAAAQFDKYHSFDNVDRENGIWRYFSHYKAFGKEKARKELLKYEKDDREPFPSVYQLFAGTITPDEIAEKIKSADISATEREKRWFYAHLYIGLHHAIEGRDEPAKQSLELMMENTWGPKAGFGPHYMWQVGRLHLELLKKPATD